MCGIVGFNGHSDCFPFLINGLKSLEYRGYDSWGVAIRQDSGEIIVRKDVGKIKDVNIRFDMSGEAIGHTRWATHGGVTVANSHPHQVGKVTLVHNGIFENYLEVKSKYQDQGIGFRSDTDTEVIAVMVNDYVSKGMSVAGAIRQAAEMITGRFSLLVVVEGEPGIYAARRGSPLIIGRGETGTFIASDIPALLEHTNVVNYLDDDEMVHIKGTKVEFTSLLDGNMIEKRDVTVSWKAEQASKGDYSHFMIKEIFDQKLLPFY